MKISEIDNNLKVETGIKEPGIRFFDPRQAPFTIHGLIPPPAGEVGYRRVPKDVAAATSEGVLNLSTMTPGGRIRFRTTSPYVAIKATYPHEADIPGQMTRYAAIGYSMYVTENGRQTYKDAFIPSNTVEYESIKYLPRDGVARDVTIYLPIFTSVDKIMIGLDADATLDAAAPYRIEKPVVYYGSSITHGGCANRPGNCYEDFISRTLDCDYINLGFAGCAKGEAAMAEYIATLDMSAFVLDYDHNANSVDSLRATHEPFFKIVRAAHPDLPILVVSRPVKYPSDEEKERREVIRETVERAKAAGDKHVFFLDGSTFYDELDFNDGTVEGLHPTDLGFFMMAKKIGAALKEAVKE